MIRLSNHATDSAVLLLRIDQLHNTVIGSFQPARRQDDLGVGVYVMEADKLDSLRAWARHQNIHLLDETRHTGEPTRPLECANTLPNGDRCAAPYRASHIPRFCGTCGQPANPVVFESDEPLVGAKCPGCHRVLAGGPAYCPHCGATMPERHLRAPAIPRVKGEPKPLGQAVAELKDHLEPPDPHVEASRAELHPPQERTVTT